MSKLEQVKEVKRLYLDLIAEHCKQASQMLSTILSDSQSEAENDRMTNEMDDLIAQAFGAIANMSTDDYVQALDFPPVLEELTSVNAANREILSNMLTEMLDNNADEDDVDGGYSMIFLMRYINDICQLHNFVETWLHAMAGYKHITTKEADTLIDELDQRYFNDTAQVIPIINMSGNIVNQAIAAKSEKGQFK